MEANIHSRLNSQSLESEDRFPTPGELKEIKQMLLSGDKEQILNSVEKINAFVNNENSLVELIRSDISEFLCDAIILFDEVITRAIYTCLEWMAKNSEFFTQSHSCYTIESLIRSTYFLLKSSNSTASLSQCLDLLVIIIQGYDGFNVTPEKKTIENLVHLLPALLKSSNLTVSNKYQIGELILALSDLNSLNLTQQISELILSSLSCCFNLLNDIIEFVHPLKDKFIDLCCMMCHSALRSLATKDSSVEDFDTYTICSLKIELCNNVSNYLIKFGIPYFDSIPLSITENDPTKLECFFETVLYISSEEFIPQRSNLVHGLGEAGLLQFTTRVISFADFEHGQKLRKLCMLVLSNMILQLSEDVFQYPEIWPNGREDFSSEIQRGIAQLPLDPSQWLDVLVCPHSPGSCKLALLLYLYFYSLTAESQAILETIYPSIINFINYSNGIESCVLLVKIVWFVYGMSQLSSSHKQIEGNEIEATNKMVSLLEAQNDLSLVYTHHPALLYWAFSSKLNTCLQSKVVCLWLRNKSPDCKELEGLMGRSPDVRFAILDILQNECGQILESAFSSLKSVLLESNDDNLASNIWFLLPQVLAKYTTDSTSATNVDYVIELASLKAPDCLNIGKVIRIASLLPEVLVKSDLISVLPSLSLALQLLQLGFQMEDFRVVNIFLRFDGFIQKIMEGMKAVVSDISVYSLRIVTLLWQKCKGINNPENHKKIKVKKETILKVLESNSVEVLSTGLEFLEEVLVTGFSCPVFDIEEVDSNFFEILFLEIQNLCFKSFPATSSACWRCLKQFLLLREEFVGVELSTNPLLHEIINYHLIHLKESSDLREFIGVWLDENNSKWNDSCFERRIFGEFYQETVENIARCLEEDFSEEDKTLYEKVRWFSSVARLQTLNEQVLDAHCLGRFCLWTKHPLNEFSLTSISPSSRGS